MLSVVGCRTITLLSCAFALSSGAISQGPHDPPTSPRKVLFDGPGTKVKGLTYSETAQPLPNGPIGSQYASFILSLGNTTPPSGHTEPEAYRWVPAKGYVGGPAPVAGSLVISGNVNGATALGEAFGPGVYGVSCFVTYRLTMDNSLDEIAFDGNCAVNGGPIYVGVGGGSIPTLSHDEKIEAAPWCIQYFGYSHWNPPPSPNLNQRTQDAGAWTLLQPEGTEHFWLVPAPLESPQLIIGESGPSYIGLFAEGASGPVEVRCMYDLVFVGMHGDVDSEIAIDDTSLTPRIDIPSIKETSKITAHKPHDVVSRELIENIPSFTSTQSACGIPDYMQLRDQLGQLMPGVWVQERFNPNDVPQGIDINTWGINWTTVLQPQNRYLLGDFSAADSVWCRWTGPGARSTIEVPQQYWGATKLTLLSGPGVHVGNFKLKYVPGAPGTAGTASHPKQ